MKEVIAVSACLLGVHCRYDGGSKLDAELVKKLKGKRIVPICPEQLGGLTTPRLPSEIQEDGETVLDSMGRDVTSYFDRGKKAALMILQSEGCKKAILCDRSPSCGISSIHDGSFTGNMIPGEGITTKFLRENGISIIDVTEEGEL